MGRLNHSILAIFIEFYLNALQLFNIWPLSPLVCYLNISKTELTKNPGHRMENYQAAEPSNKLSKLDLLDSRHKTYLETEW